MRYLKQAVAVLAAALTITVLVAIISPKTAHAIAATLVQIVPGTTTHVGQNEGQLVSLICQSTYQGLCVQINPIGGITGTPYTVPAGYTLIITDWEYSAVLGGPAGIAEYDNLFVTSNGVVPGNFVLGSQGVTAASGYLYEHERYTTGIRVISGWQVGDTLAEYNGGSAYLQGYLVPN